MAGFSIVLLIMFFCWPFVVLMLAVYLAAALAIEFVKSPAFPCLLGSFAFGTLAAIDVARILWRHYKEKEAFPLSWGRFKRPAVLAALSFALFVAMCVVCGAMIYAWVTSV